MTDPVTLDRPVAVLLVDDDEDDFLIARDMLIDQHRARFEIKWIPEYDAALRELQGGRHDICLVDYRLGERTGIELITEAFAAGVRQPVIMLTGESDQRIDLDASSLGITDFLTKQELTPTALERSIRYAITQHRAMRELARSEERYALAVRGANDGIWDWDLGSDRVYLSARWCAIVGWPEHDIEEDSDTWFSLVHPDDRPRFDAGFQDHLANGERHVELEHRIRHADGGWRWVLTRGVAIRGVDGEATRMAGSVSDVTDRHEAEARLAHDALHDSLTDLPNRVLFMDRLEHALARAERDEETRCAILFLDIDGFKLVNDSLSHAAGDRLLVSLAGRLRGALRPGDSVARIGGDEFALLLEQVDDEGDAVVVAERLLTVLRRPFRVADRQHFLTASIGIAMSGGGACATDLLRNADIAMYDAKRQGRGRCALFDDSMHRRAVDRLARENDLRRALDAGLLRVHYQPIIDLDTGEIRAFEALVRWPEGWGAVPPSEFVPVAEETGLIGELGLHVLRVALHALAGWRDGGLVDESVYVSVNVSGRQLDDIGLAEHIRIACDAAGLPMRALRLELTESVLMQDTETVQAVLTAFSDLGIRLHLDDFGTGYSSLGSLQRLPVEALKIDRSFVKSLRESGENDAIVRSTVAMAHSLGLQVIAEGVEDSRALAQVDALGCDYAQGYHFSRPLDEAAVPDLLRERRGSRSLV